MRPVCGRWPNSCGSRGFRWRWARSDSSLRTVLLRLYWSKVEDRGSKLPARWEKTAMAMFIAILEDNEERQAVMHDCLKDRFHQFEIRFFDAADEMIKFLDRHLPNSILISLDHDLELKHSPDGK